MAYKINKTILVLSLSLFILSLLIILTVNGKEGIGWDFTDQYLNGRTLINPNFYKLNLPVNNSRIVVIVNKLPGQYQVNKSTQLLFYFIAPRHIYFSLVREPFAPLMMALAQLISGIYAIQIYLFILLALLLFASFFVSKELNINPLLLTSLLFAPYILRWDVLINSTEVLSLSLALIAVGLVAKKKSTAGVVIAIIGLTKYPGLILLPLPLLINDTKKRIMSYYLFALVTAPWLIFNYIVFGDAIVSYKTIIAESLAVPAGTSLTGLLWLILLYPLAILAALLLILVIKARKEIKLEGILSKLDSRYQLVLSFLFLSLLGLMIVYNHVGDPQRFGYFLYGSIALVIALVADSRQFEGIRLFIDNYKVDLSSAAPYAVYTLSLLMLCLMYLSVSSGVYQSWLGQAGTNNPSVISAVSKLKNTNFSRCSALSNAWPFLNYYNVTAYEPNLCTNHMLQYPVVLFRNVGPDEYCNKLINYSLISPATNYSIYVPGNYICEHLAS